MRLHINFADPEHDWAVMNDWFITQEKSQVRLTDKEWQQAE